MGINYCLNGRSKTFQINITPQTQPLFALKPIAVPKMHQCDIRTIDIICMLLLPVLAARMAVRKKDKMIKTKLFICQGPICIAHNHYIFME